MPARQHHRGRHPADDQDFHPRNLPTLRAAVHDLSWLASRGYNRTAALKIAGDHYQLTARQRMAADRCACADADLDRRRRAEVPPGAVAGQMLVVDGYNLLISVESGLAGGVLLRGRDGCLRDMASLHGSYRRVDETRPAVALIGARLAALRPARVQWYFDQPVSNSGRLKQIIEQEAAAAGWPWEVALLPNPDPAVAASEGVAVSADSWVIDHAARWLNLAPHVLESVRPPESITDLSLEADAPG